MFAARTLLISQDSSLIETLRNVVLSLRNCHLEVVARSDDALPYLTDENLGLVVVHLAEGHDSGAVALIRKLTTSRLAVATLVVSDTHESEQELAMLRLGAADYLVRPLDLARLVFLVDVLTVRSRYKGHMPAVEPSSTSPPSFGEYGSFLYRSAEMAKLMVQVRKVAARNTNILLTGETGTGKTRLARLIHELSVRRDKPFLVVNCAALPVALIEAELFGHVKGAFTGADYDRAGKFSEAGAGTLLLDEIDALPPATQAKLLHAVDERSFEQVGSNRALQVQARFIAASNRSLDEEVSAGRFRADLYHRLNVLMFDLPALRERRSEIRELAEKFATQITAGDCEPVPYLSPDAVQVLELYDWPGNLRELRNVIERAITFCTDNTIRIDDLPEVFRRLSASVPRPDTSLGTSGVRTGEGPVVTEHHTGLEPRKTTSGSSVMADSPHSWSQTAFSVLSKVRMQAEIDRIMEALERHNNNRLRAARELGISRVTLYKKLHKYGLMPTQ